MEDGSHLPSLEITTWYILVVTKLTALSDNGGTVQYSATGRLIFPQAS